MELGNGFGFLKNEYKIKLGERYNYIDLLLYNIKHKCYVVVELKVTELKSEHIGQIEKYVNYIDKNIKTIDENKTIGIIICKKQNKYIIEYCSDESIIDSEYRLKKFLIKKILFEYQIRIFINFIYNFTSSFSHYYCWLIIIIFSST